MLKRIARWSAHSTALLAMVLSPSLLWAGSPGPISAEPGKDHISVDMFDAMAKGEIEVALIPKDAKEATVMFKNKTDKPLAIKLPEAFAGVPVLAQFGGGGFGGGGGGFGGGIMNVAPDTTRKVEVKTVCLEHGKKDPTPRVKYEIKPIESFTDKAEVAELCKLLGQGQLAQNTAQAAAWHIMDGLTWNELARKDRVKLRSGYTQKWFSRGELTIAMRAVNFVTERAKQSPSTSVASQNDSLSQQD